MNKGGGERSSRAFLTYALGIALLAALVLLYCAFSSGAKSKLYGLEAASVREKSEVAAQLVDVRISSIRRLLERLASDAARGQKIAGVSGHYSDVLGVTRVGYVTSDGRQTVVSADETNGRAQNVSEEEFFSTVMRGEFALQGAKYDKHAASGQSVVFAAPIKNGGVITGAVTAVADSQVFVDIIASARFDKRGVAFLCVGDDDILSADDEAIDSFASELSELIAARSDFINYAGPNGMRGVAVKTPTQTDGMYIVSFVTGGVSAFDAVAEALPRIVLLAVFAVLIMLSLAAAAIGQRRERTAVSVALAETARKLRAAISDNEKLRAEKRPPDENAAAIDASKRTPPEQNAPFENEAYDVWRDDISSDLYRRSRCMLAASDCEPLLKTVSEAFEDNCQVISVRDADGVFRQLARHASSVYCVLLDMEIPGMNGREVAKSITQNEAYIGIPVIALSDKCQSQAQLDAISAGACDLIEKNTEAGLLRVRVERTLTRIENDTKRAIKSYSLFQNAREERYRRVLDATGTLVFTHDITEDRYQYGPDASKFLSGGFDARSLDRIFIDDCNASVSEVAKMMAAAEKVERGTSGEDKAEYVLRLKTPSGDMHWFKTRFIRTHGKGEPTRKTLITLNDINDEVEASEALKFRAERDTLTRLYNSETFYEKVAEMIRGKKPGDYTLCSVDVDSFKVLNDRYGHAEGDRLLKFIAALLREAVEPVGGICCRVWGDCFCYAFPSGNVSTKFVLRTIDRKCREYTGMTSFTLSTGAYIIDDCSLPINLIYDRATIAKKSVKGSYLHHIAYYTDDMRDEILAEQAIVAQMENALKTGQFEVYLQPQFALNSSSLVGAEALVRWNHPEKGLIPPARFIPIFEKNGFISRLDRYVWERTLIVIKSWRDLGQKLVPISVNVSRSELLEGDFFSFITGLIDSYGLPKELFNVEITETAFAGAPGIIVDTVRRLKEYGVVVEIDDFGSGYSSLNTLKDVPADILKLDMRFMQNSGDSKRGGAIVHSVIRMARLLDMAVIAEGVETREQADFLRSIGCRYAQGYLYAHPMTVAEFERIKDSAVFEESMARFNKRA